MKNIMLILLMTLVLGLTIYPMEGKAQMGPGYGMGQGMMGGWGMGWFGMIFMLIFWVLVIVGLVLLVKWLIQTTKGDKDVVHSSSRALEILNERYAKGEIEKEEFEKVKRDLQS